jgi:hypothetical protein
MELRANAFKFDLSINLHHNNYGVASGIVSGLSINDPSENIKVK